MNLVLDAQVFTVPYISFIVGLLFCFLGRKLLGVIVILFGFLIGYTLGAVLLADIMGSSISSSPWMSWVGGVVGIVLGLVAWQFSMFLIGAVMGLFIARGLLPEVSGIAHAGIALTAGILVHLYRDPIIVLLTAISGAYIAAGSAVIMMRMIGFLDAVGINSISSNAAAAIVIVLTGIFALTGYKFQTRDINT
ncbi:MAG: hypothetical protein KAT09_01075 [Candidatus Aegiribacteria sp.]|nr:hypothetical protein [Candidatus Aegiribacteria sp.]